MPKELIRSIEVMFVYPTILVLLNFKNTNFMNNRQTIGRISSMTAFRQNIFIYKTTLLMPVWTDDKPAFHEWATSPPYLLQSQTLQLPFQKHCGNGKQCYLLPTLSSLRSKRIRTHCVQRKVQSFAVPMLPIRANPNVGL